MQYLTKLLVPEFRKRMPICFQKNTQTVIAIIYPVFSAKVITGYVFWVDENLQFCIEQTCFRYATFKIGVFLRIDNGAN